MNRKIFRVIIVASLVALAGLLTVQIYWFTQAYRLQEKQFDEKVNLALRSVADQILKSKDNTTVRILPIRQTSSNSFFVQINQFVPYQQLDSVVRLEFEKQNVREAFSLSLFDQSDSLILGAYHPLPYGKTEESSCIAREQQAEAINFAVRFPNKTNSMLGEMNLWVFTSGTFLLVLVLFSFVIIDLSKQKKLAEMKSDFINNMTHELQTPITNISMASEILTGGRSLDERRRQKYLDIIQQENHRLKLHVDQVLQSATMNRGNFTLAKDKLDLHDVLTNVAQTFQVRIDKRKGNLSLDLKAQKSLLVGDRNHLSNIFYNLLDNAEKYSRDSVDIAVQSKNTPKGLLVTIADKGIGIRHDVQQFIFDQFYRSSTGNLHDVKGFGLGLSYVRKIVEAHNGSITVESELNKGSSFHVFLPS